MKGQQERGTASNWRQPIQIAPSPKKAQSMFNQKHQLTYNKILRCILLFLSDIEHAVFQGS